MNATARLQWNNMLTFIWNVLKSVYSQHCYRNMFWRLLFFDFGVSALELFVSFGPYSVVNNQKRRQVSMQV